MRSYSEFLGEISEYRSSVWMLVAANIVPLFGVLFLSWDAFQVVALYWVESVVIGLISILKIAACDPDLAEVDSYSMNWFERRAWSVIDGRPQSVSDHHLSKLFSISFFVLPFAIFCSAQGMIVAYAFGAGEDVGEGHIRFSDHELRELRLDQLAWAAVALSVSHLYSFLRNYLGGGECRHTVVSLLMLQPFGRVLMLYAAILIGMLFSSVLGESMGILSVLIAGKTLLDLWLHLRERERNARTLSEAKLHAAVRD